MKTLTADTVPDEDLGQLEAAVKRMNENSPLAHFLAALAAAVRDGVDVVAGRPSDLVSPSQAASLLGVSRVHLYKVMDAGEMPFVNVGRDRRVSLGSVYALMERRDAASKAQAERFAHTQSNRDEALASLRR